MPRNDFNALVAWAMCVYKKLLPATRWEYGIAKTLVFASLYGGGPRYPS